MRHAGRSRAQAGSASRVSTRPAADRSPGRSWRRRCPRSDRIPPGLADSKVLSAAEREDSTGASCATAVAVSVAFAGPARDRSRQYPAGVAVGAGAAPSPPCRAGQGVCRRPRPKVPCDCDSRPSSRRCAGALDRRRLDRREGHARPADDADRRRAPAATASSGIWAIRCRNISRRCSGSGLPSTTGGAFHRSRSPMA